MRTRFLNIFNIEAEEAKLSGLFFALSFCLGLFLSFYFVVANSEFISVYGASKIPYAYITTGFLGFFVIKLFSRLKKKVRIQRLYPITFSCLLALMLFFKLISSDFVDIPILSKYSPFILFVWIGPLFSICGIGFSDLFLGTFNLAQSKRLYALLYSGEVMSSILGYFTVSVLLMFLHERSDLLFISAFGMVGVLMVLRYIIPLIHKEAKTNEVKTKEKKQKTLNVFKRKYFGLIVLVASFSGLAAYLSDFGFLGATQLIAGGDKQRVIEIIAIFYGIVKVFELILSFLSGRILNRYGMKFGIHALAVGMMFCTGVAYLVSIIVPMEDVAFVLFFFLALNRMADRVLRKAIETPSFKILIQPIHDKYKFQVQTTVDGTVKQLTIGLAGCVIITINLFFKDVALAQSLIYFSLVFVLITITWIFFSSKLYEEYKAKITLTLTKIGFIDKSNELPLDSIKNEIKSKDVLKRDWNSIILNEISSEAVPKTDRHKLHFELNEQEKQSAHYTKSKLSTPYLCLNIKETIDLDYELYNTKNKLLELLESGKHQLIAIEKFKTFGDSIIPEMEVLFSRTKNNTVKTRILEGYASLNTELSISKILKKINVTDNYVQKCTIDILYNIKYSVSEEDKHIISMKYEKTLMHLTWLLTCKYEIDNDLDAIQEALNEDYDYHYNILFKLLSFMYNYKSIALIKHHLEGSESLESNIYALELIDNFFEKEDKEVLMPICSSGSLNRRVKQLQKRFPMRSMTSEKRLENIINKSTFETTAWLKVEALNVLPEVMVEKRMIKVLKACIFSNERIISEVAGRLFFKLNEPLFQQFVNYIEKDEKRNILQIINQEVSMYDVIKKMKKISIFNAFSYLEMHWCLNEMQAKIVKSSSNGFYNTNHIDGESSVILDGNISIDFIGDQIPTYIDNIYYRDDPHFHMEKAIVEGGYKVEFSTANWIQFISTDYELYQKTEASFIDAIGETVKEET